MDEEAPKREDQIAQREADRFNPAQRAATALKNKEDDLSPYAGAGIGQAEAFANDPKNAEALAGAKPATRFKYSPSQKSNPSKKKLSPFKAAMARSAVAFVLVILLGPIGFLLTFISNPLISIMENASLTNDTRASFLQKRLVKVIDRKIKAATDKNISNSIETVAGRLNSFPNKLLLELDNAGLKPIGAGDYSSGKGYSNRAPTHIEIKDTGEKIPIGDFTKAITNNPEIGKSVTKAFNTRFMAYSGKFISRVFYEPKKISQRGGVIDESKKVTTPGSVEAEVKSLTSVEKEFSDSNVMKERLKPLLEDVLKKQATKATKTADPILLTGGMGCMAVNGPRTIASVIRGVLLARAVVAASDILLSPGSKIKAGDATDKEANAAATTVTTTDSNGKSALDSPILQSALGINKNKVQLGAWVAAYSFMSSGLVQGSMVAGAASRPGCDAIMSPEAFAVSAAISAASAATGPGAAVYAAAKAAAWTLIKFKGAELAIDAVTPLAATLVTLILDKSGLGEELVKLIQYNAKQGEDLGNYLGMALLAFFSDAGLKSNEATLTKDQAQSFKIAVTDPYRIAYEQNVQNTLSPFDTSSQYTFLGSIVSRLGYLNQGNINNFSSLLASISHIPALALASPQTMASAPIYDYSKECGFGTSKVALNAACTPYTGMPVEYINMPSNTAQDMVDSDAIDDNVSDITQSIKPDSKLGLQLADCASGSIEVLDGCTVSDEKSAAGFVFATDLQVESMLDGSDDDTSTQQAPPTQDSKSFTSASISLTAATYNVRRIGLGGSAEKTMQAANLMKTKGVAIFGAQEVSPKQFNIIKSAGFDGKLASGRGLFWDSSKLKLESYGTFMGKKDSDKANEPMQWAKFSAGGGSFYYINVHGDAHNNSRSEYTAQKTLEQIKSIQSSDANANIIVGGDMNGNTQVQAALYNNLKTVLKYSLDIASQKNGVNCDTIHPIGKQDCKAAGKLGSHRDMIFVSNGISIESWDNVTDGTASISDHNPVVTKLTIPGLSTGSVSMRASSFNLLGASHTTNWSQRMTKSIAVIDGSSLKDKQPLDIVGLQETTPVQQNSLKRQLSNYSFYPEDSSVQNPIMWNSSKFALVDGGLMPNLKYFNNNPLKAPWVLLKPVGATDASSFYVLNTHDPAHKEYAKERYDNANQHVDFIKKIKSSGKPIIFTGDFNSGFSLRSQARENITWQNKNANLTYCILTKGGLMNNAFDMSPKRAVKCPNPGNNNSVDHIYISPDVSVTQYFTVSAGSNGSDHDTQIADLSLSNSTAGSSTSQTSANSQLGPQGFSGGQCVDYVKWILARHSSKYHGGTLGNGGWVTEGLGRLGYTVDHTPAVYSTVSFKKPNGSSNSAGHTAIVTAVNSDGSIWVDESNYDNPGNYGHRLVSASVAQASTTTYAHTEDGWH